MDTGDWRLQLQPGSRQRILKKMCKHFPFNFSINYPTSSFKIMAESSRAAKRKVLKTSRAGKRKASRTSRAAPKRFSLSGNPSITFSSNESVETFMSSYAWREIIPPRYVVLSALELLNVSNMIHHLGEVGLLEFVQMHSLWIHEDLIRVFYCNLKLEEDILFSEVNGVEIMMSIEDFGSLFGLPTDGGTFEDDEWKNFVENDCKNLMNFRPHYNPSGRPKIEGLSVEYRVLLYLITRLLHARSGNHTNIWREDFEYLYAILTHKRMNWAYIFVQYMLECKDPKKKVLPFPLAVEKILVSYGVDLTVGTRILEKKNWVITKTTFRFNLDDEPTIQRNVPAPVEQVAQPSDVLQQILASMQRLIQGMQGLTHDMQEMSRSIRRVERRQLRHEKNLQRFCEHTGVEYSTYPASESDHEDN